MISFLIFIILWATTPRVNVVFSPTPLSRYVDMAPPAIQMIYYSQKFSKEYKIPYYIFRNCGKAETGFRNQKDYNPAQISPAGALGPHQVMYSTAKSIWPRQQFTPDKLLGIKFNLESSAKYLAYLHTRYGSWLKAASFYNQGVVGLEHINNYARTLVSE